MPSWSTSLIVNRGTTSAGPKCGSKSGIGHQKVGWHQPSARLLALVASTQTDYVQSPCLQDYMYNHSAPLYISNMLTIWQPARSLHVVKHMSQLTSHCVYDPSATSHSPLSAPIHGTLCPRVWDLRLNLARSSKRNLKKYLFNLWFGLLWKCN